MATEYDLRIASDIDSDSLLRIVEDSLGLDHFRHPEFRSERNPSLVGRGAPGFLLTAAAEDALGAEILEEWLGFRPKVSVGFRMINNDETWPAPLGQMMHATSAVLERVAGDAALILNYDTGRLIRRNGRVTISEEIRIYYPEALAEIRVPYEFGRVPTAADAPDAIKTPP